MDDSSDAEFLEDLGDALTDAQIQRLLAHARVVEDREMRLLAKQYSALRRATRWLLADLERAAEITAVWHGEAARLARFFAGDEPPGSGVGLEAS